MKKLLILFVALCLCVFCVPAGALAEASYDYENSALVRVLCDGQRNFDGSDFPEIEDCEVYVASKTKTDNGFEYVLILSAKGGKRAAMLLCPKPPLTIRIPTVKITPN